MFFVLEFVFLHGKNYFFIKKKNFLVFFKNFLLVFNTFCKKSDANFDSSIYFALVFRLDVPLSNKKIFFRTTTTCTIGGRREKIFLRVGVMMISATNYVHCISMTKQKISLVSVKKSVCAAGAFTVLRDRPPP